MMSNAEEAAILCKEALIALDGDVASPTATECTRKAVAVEIEQNAEEELTSRLATFIGNEGLCEDTTVVDMQIDIAEEKVKTYATYKNKTEEAHNADGALSKKGASTTDEATEKGVEVDTPSSSKEMCAVNETEEEETEADIANVTPFKDAINIAEESVEENTETQNLSAALSRNEMDTTEEGTVAQHFSEVGITEEAIEKNSELHNVIAMVYKEVSITEKGVEKTAESQNFSAPAPVNEISSLHKATEKMTEDQNFGAIPCSKKVSTTEHIQEILEPFNEEMGVTEEAVEKRSETQNLGDAPPDEEMSTTEKAVEKRSGTQNLSDVLFNEEMSTTEEHVQERSRTQNLSDVPSDEEMSTTEHVQEVSEPPDEEMSTTEKAVEKRSRTQNLSDVPSDEEMSITEEAVEKRSETQCLSDAPSDEEMSTTEEHVQERSGTQNLSAVLFNEEMSIMPFNEEMSTTEEVTEKRPEAQNSSAVLSNKEESITQETLNLNATLSNLEVSTTRDSSQKCMETPNFSAALLKEVSSTDEVGEKRTEGQNLVPVPSSEEAAPTKEKIKAQKLTATPSMKGKNLKLALKKRIKYQNLGDALPERKTSIPEVTVKEEMTDDVGIPVCNKEMSTLVEENDSSVCGPSAAVEATEKNKEESKASTSTSCSRSIPGISSLRNLPRDSRGRFIPHSRRALTNQQAQQSQGIHFAFNGKTMAPKRPRVSVPRVHVTAEAFPSLASELYSLLPEAFKDAVSLSMMEYYLMILYHHRLAGLRMNRRKPLLVDEVLCSNLELGPLFVPEIFEQWITMRGHDVNTRGETIRLILPPIPSETGDFGRVSATTHWRYISDLAPRIFRDRIVADLQYTISSGPVEWDLHEDIRPQEKNCGLPTRNLIGYHVAQKLTPSQIDELHLCGIGLCNDKAVFPVDIDAECYHFNTHLVKSVSQHFAALGSQFHIVRHAPYDSQPSSAGLIVYEERMVSETEEYLFDRSIGHYEQAAKVRAYAPVAMDKELAKGAVVFLPRVYRRDGKRPVSRSWCAYDFGFYFMVPDEWTATRNNAYKQGTWQSWHTPHLTTASITRANLLKAVVKHSLLSQEQHE